MENENYSKLLKDVEKEVMYNDKMARIILIIICVIGILSSAFLLSLPSSSSLISLEKIVFVLFLIIGSWVLVFARILIDYACSKNKYEQAKLEIKFMKLRGNVLTEEEKSRESLK